MKQHDPAMDETSRHCHACLHTVRRSYMKAALCRPSAIGAAGKATRTKPVKQPNKQQKRFRPYKGTLEVPTSTRRHNKRYLNDCKLKKKSRDKV